MPRIAYTDQKFRRSSLEVIAQAVSIASEYAAQGYDLTLRQVYYQFVARGLLANSDKNYKRLGSIINDARMAGLMDWNHITDRTRYLRSASYWESPAQIIETAAQGFQRNLWAVTGQHYRPEVWVEKDALVGVVGRACDPLRVPYMSCRGYVSQSEMWSACRRMRLEYQRGLQPVVIHLGDHDPSGLDMTRDITDRLWTFAEQEVPVIRVALNMDQVEQYAPPPNPAKLTDSRGTAYVEQHGYESWELDALEPRVLDALIRDALDPYIDREAWQVGEDEDEAQRTRMGVVAARWDDLADNWDQVADLLDEQQNGWSDD